MRGGGYDAVLLDLLTGVLDSWTLWSSVAGDEGAGTGWRRRYLELTYGQGDYAPYELLVARAAEDVGLPRSLADDLLARWAELTPWPEAPAVLGAIARELPIGVVTNCSAALGAAAAAQVPVAFATVVTAERAGAYKPRPAAYLLALAELGLPADRVLFVAGSAFDLPGATGAGMDVWWHNRAGMTAPAGAPAPIGEARSLEPLLEVLGGSARH
ncbi:HAD-IA family hydrolase [Amnibacterium endophyticum]|uniref:HAD-IA family hydrolase n=1 Tax=Amnibacterium endophyticum TaxID=2109337 RepID=A0ABW4LG82_9MICO